MEGSSSCMTPQLSTCSRVATIIAVLWDVRVHPDARGRGVGRALIQRVEERAEARACSELKVETQNVNVPACRFYERCGFELRHAVAGAYPELPDEVMFLWYKRI